MRATLFEFAITATAFTVSTGRRIGADNEKFPVGGQTLVPYARRNDNHIAGGDTNRRALIATKPQRGSPASDPEGFMDARMIMHEVVNAIAPSLAPTIGAEDGFEKCCRVASTIKAYSLAVEEKGDSSVVRDVTVGAEFHASRFGSFHP